MIKTWQKLATRPVYDSTRINLRVDTCKLPDGSIIDDYIVGEIPDGVTIISITKSKEILLVKQYKHGIGKVVLELPAGNVDGNEDPLEAINRELTEETGYIASKVEYIFSLCSKPARFSAKTHVYFAEDVLLDTKKLKKSNSEIIEVVLVPVQQLPLLISGGAIITETSLAAILLVWNRIATIIEKSGKSY